MTQPGTPLRSDLAAWTAYLNAIEASVRAMTADLAAGLEVAWPELVPPAGPLPASLDARRRSLITALDAAAALIIEQRDAIGSELVSLARRPTDPMRNDAARVGHTLDIKG